MKQTGLHPQPPTFLHETKLKLQIEDRNKAYGAKYHVHDTQHASPPFPVLLLRYVGFSCFDLFTTHNCYLHSCMQFWHCIHVCKYAQDKYTC
nr:MAG TPA: hypothetical protein [Inoviridae sp.]